MSMEGMETFPSVAQFATLYAEALKKGVAGASVWGQL
jgi:hypothetical protein